MGVDLPTRYDLPPLARLESNWHPPWLISRLVQHGPMHLQQGEPPDDSHVIGAAGEAFWMVAADGVGSEPNSRHGARIACAALDTLFGKRLSSGALPSRELMKEGFAAAHAAIHQASGKDYNAYATTLSAVIIRGDTIVGGSIGDSGIAIGTQHEDGEATRLVLSPFCSAPQGNRKGGTYTIVRPDWEAVFASHESHSPHPSMVIVATDGAERFFIKSKGWNQQDAFDPSWPAHLEGRLAALGHIHFIHTFAQFSYEVLDPTEVYDDRTLLVAFRPPAHLAPPAPKPRGL